MEKQESLALTIKNRDELIKNPMMLLERMGGLSLRQGKIVMKVIEILQPRINDYLDHYEERKKSKQTGLFDESDFVNPRTVSGGMEFTSDYSVGFTIQYSDLDVQPCDYNEVDKAAEALSGVIVPVTRRKEDGDIETVWSPLFTVGVTRKVSGRRKSYITVYMSELVATQLAKMDHGYSEHIRTIYHHSKCVYCPQLLDLMYKWFRQSPKMEVEYGRLRELMGLIERDTSGNVVNERYKAYKDFRKRVLDAAKADADRLWRDGKTHFTFDYAAIYKGRSSKGEPDSVLFTMNQESDNVIELTNSPTLPAASAEMWQKFLSLAAERVGTDVIAKYDGAYWMANMTDTQVVIGVANKVVLPLLSAKIFVPCADIFHEIFGDRTGDFTVK